MLVHHAWLRMVAWLFIMSLDFSFWKLDTFPMSLDLCRFYLGDYVMSFMFLDLCLVDGVVVLKVNFWVHWDGGKHHVLWWSTRCDSFVEEQKDFVVIIFSLVSIYFQDWWFSWLVKRCRRKILQPLKSGLLTSKSLKEGLDSQWEGWQFSKHRENSGSATAREQWLRDIVNCSARHVKVFRWLSKILFK